MAKNKFQLTYDHIKRENQFLKILVLMLSVVILVVVLITDKDPLVIRESLTDIELIDIKSSQLNEYDVEIFLRHFINNLNLYDSYKIDDAYLSLNMMDESLRNRFLNDVFKQGAIQSIKNMKATTTTTFQEISFEQQGSNQLKATVIYTRTQDFFHSKETKDHVIRLDIMATILKGRSKHNPYGMVVSEYKRTKLGAKS